MQLTNEKERSLVYELKGLGNIIRSMRKNPHWNTLIAMRNDWHHQRISLDPALVEECSGELRLALDSCMEDIAFLSRFPVRFVAKNDSNRQGKVKLTCLRYMGDRSSFIKEILPYPTSLASGDLYIELLPDRWRPLWPFIQTGLCRGCDTDRAYYIEKWRRGKATLKSFDCSHTREDEEVAAFMEKWQHGDVMPAT